MAFDQFLNVLLNTKALSVRIVVVIVPAIVTVRRVDGVGRWVIGWVVSIVGNVLPEAGWLGINATTGPSLGRI